MTRNLNGLSAVDGFGQTTCKSNVRATKLPNEIVNTVPNIAFALMMSPMRYVSRQQVLHLEKHLICIGQIFRVV